MGMSIDIAIKNGSDLIDVFKEYFPNDKAIDTVGELVEIAEKYQKIVGIVSLNGEEFKQCGLKELKEILEVIADGKTD